MSQQPPLTQRETVMHRYRDIAQFNREARKMHGAGWQIGAHQLTGKQVNVTWWRDAPIAAAPPTGTMPPGPVSPMHPPPKPKIPAPKVSLRRFWAERPKPVRALLVGGAVVWLAIYLALFLSLAASISHSSANRNATATARQGTSIAAAPVTASAKADRTTTAQAASQATQDAKATPTRGATTAATTNATARTNAPTPSAAPASATAPAPTAVPTSAPVVVTVKDAPANVRQSADQDSAVIATVPVGADLFVIAEDATGPDGATRWVPVQADGKDGFVRSDLVTPRHVPTPTPVPPTATRVPPTATLTSAQQATQLKDEYPLIDANDLAKRPDFYKGKKFSIVGTISDVSEKNGITAFNLSAETSAGNTVIVAVGFQGTSNDLQIGIRLRAYCVGIGTFSGTNGFGAKLTEPAASADHLGPP